MIPTFKEVCNIAYGKAECYHCGNIREGRMATIAVDDKHDEVYQEFFCFECLSEKRGETK